MMKLEMYSISHTGHVKKKFYPYLFPERWQTRPPSSLKDNRTQMSRLTSPERVIYDMVNMKCSTSGSGGGSNESGRCDTTPQAGENLP
ncbi:MAG: hypothetical protein ABIJ57_11295 [Pseudomonadota bacterium]